MQINNTTPINAEEYDAEITKTIPFYQEFHAQTINVIQNMGFTDIKWLDLGCGTGLLMKKAALVFDQVDFVMADPSEEMLEQAKQNNPEIPAEYIVKRTDQINYKEHFNVVTAIQSNHYMPVYVRKRATRTIYRAMQEGGIYIAFENIVPESSEVREAELRRWGEYQLAQGKDEEDVKAHIARCGLNYFPLTITRHKRMLETSGFHNIHVFWQSYMQAGIYAVK